MTELEVRIFGATTSRNALWVHCPTDQEKQVFLDWIVSKYPACNLQFTDVSRYGAAYAYFTDPSWGPEGVIDCLENAERYRSDYDMISFEEWLAGVMVDDDEVIECDIDTLL